MTRGAALALGLAVVATVAPARADVAGDWNRMEGMPCRTVFGEEGRYDGSERCRAGSADAGFLHVGGPPAPPHHEPAHVQVSLPSWVYVALALAFASGVTTMIVLARRRR